jgi:phosphoribosylamine---glycine ligase
METIITPTVRGLLAEGRPYVGILYAGLMMTSEGPRVLEYNARFGDPEAELIAMRMQSDLLPVLQATLNGRLDEARVAWHPGGAVCVVLAAAGYPGTPRTGDPITGVEGASRGDEVQVFHAATRIDTQRLVTAGGRVLTVTARGATFREARERCRAATGAIRFDGCQSRSDIARVAIEHEASAR